VDASCIVNIAPSRIFPSLQPHRRKPGAGSMGNVPVTEGNKDVIFKDSETAAIALSIGAPTVPDNEPLSVTINAVPLASFATMRLNGQTIAANTTLTVAQLQQLQFVPAHTGQRQPDLYGERCLRRLDDHDRDARAALDHAAVRHAGFRYASAFSGR